MEGPPAARSGRLAVRRLHHSGPRPLRVLLLGDRAVVGDPGPRHAETLADRLVDRLWLTLRRGVDLDVLTDLTPVLRAVRGAFDAWRLWRYDAVVIALPAEPGALKHVRLRHHLSELLDEVLADAAGTASLVLASPVPRSRHAAKPFPVEELLGAAPSDRIVACPVLEADDARAWAAAVAERLAPLLPAPDRAPAPDSAAALRDRPDDEAERQRALDALGIVESAPDPRFDDLVELARTAFGAQSAEINFLDRDRQWKMAVAGAERGEQPRSTSFCNLTIQSAEPTVIEDARLHPLLRLAPAVRGPRAVRFYAAYPIESADGYRVGSLCIYDSEPRAAEAVNLDVLRDLALLAQAELTGVDTGPIDSPLTSSGAGGTMGR
ncbi:hypothetical protein QDR37_09670 [Amnibacterium sp. CER49]|uniref:hypothetical protein n=1 Tax=Amnibacterium sp. CER49 TaxID=3039161 RepID=UPI00244A503D|nr:hypothetical protein [Amnibacterium sp. CER49]MDH2444211.1 hypothetical protein [Amnibacterium sp. CER49]